MNDFRLTENLITGVFFAIAIFLKIAHEYRKLRKQMDRDDSAPKNAGPISDVQRELERRLQADRERMAPPPRPAPPRPVARIPDAPVSASPARGSAPTPVTARKPVAPIGTPPPPVQNQPRRQPQPQPPAPRRNVPPPIPQPAARQRPQPKAPVPSAPKRQAAAPAAAQIANNAFAKGVPGISRPAGLRKKGRIRAAALNAKTMRRIVILNEIYNPPLALRES